MINNQKSSYLRKLSRRESSEQPMCSITNWKNAVRLCSSDYVTCVIKPSESIERKCRSRVLCVSNLERIRLVFGHNLQTKPDFPRVLEHTSLLAHLFVRKCVRNRPMRTSLRWQRLAFHLHTQRLTSVLLNVLDCDVRAYNEREQSSSCNPPIPIDDTNRWFYFN